MDKQNKELTWLGVFCILPVTLLSPLGELFSEDGSMSVLYSAVLGGLGGILGFSIYTLTKKKSGIIRVASLLAIVVLGVIIVRSLH